MVDLSQSQQILTSGRILTLGILMLLFVSCSGDDSQTPGSVEASEVPWVGVEQSATSAPVTRVAPSTTVAPSTSSPAVTSVPASPLPTSTRVAVVDELPVHPLSNAQIGSCWISGELGNVGIASVGTAPAPTPTPAPSYDERERNIVEREMVVFDSKAGSLVTALERYENAFSSAWPRAIEAEQQAAQLYVFGNRLAQLCSAISLPVIPYEVLGQVAKFAQALNNRYNWTKMALDALLCCDDAHSEFISEGFELTKFGMADSIRTLREKITEYVVSGSRPSERQLYSERFGLTMSVDSDSVLVRNSVDVVVSLPDSESLLDPDSIGPYPMVSGTSIRIRRLRNSVDLSVEEATVKVEGLVDRFGEAIEVSDLNIPTIEHLQFNYPQFENGWSGSVLVFVDAGYTYLIELICHVDREKSCDSVRQSVESIVLDEKAL